MSTSITLLTFQQAMATAEDNKQKKHILLGNGFSIGAHSQFKYGTLYEQAVNAGLSEPVKALFERLGTSNFEDVLRHLESGQWLADLYRLEKSDQSLDMREDYEAVKRALVDSIATNHPESVAAVSHETLGAGSRFLNHFDDVYTTNYDLLLYWTSLSQGDFPFEDGFGRDIQGDVPYCVFLPTGTSHKRIFFLHGALHLYASDGEVRKMVWNTTGVPLMHQIRDALDDRRYPLIVSEGESRRKLDRIEASSYLSNCARNFRNVQGNLFVYGSSLSRQDEHILDWITTNTTLPRLFVGLFGYPNDQGAHELVRRAKLLEECRRQVLANPTPDRRFKREQLQIFFFDSATANVWESSFIKHDLPKQT